MPVTAGHDLRRVDEPATELDALLDVIVQAVLLVRSAGPLGPEVRTVDAGALDRLAAAIDAAGIDSRRT